MVTFDRIKVRKLNSYIYLMDDNLEATGYLVLGKDKALIIDTMCGYENVKALVRTITDLPLMVVNTHGHSDHIYGNVYFDEAYIHPADIPVAQFYMKHPTFVEECERNHLKMAEFLPILPGEIIDLGGVELEVIGVPGHTPGGICLLLRKDRILFTGDSIIEQTWMQMEESLPMETFLESLNQLEPLWGEIDYLLTGHGQGFESPTLCKVHRDAVKELCEGKTQGDVDYEWYGGVCKAHPYGKEPRRICYKNL